MASYSESGMVKARWEQAVMGTRERGFNNNTEKRIVSKWTDNQVGWNRGSNALVPTSVQT
ncbi:hypothetical protein [Paenibacillus massiliensis]|uniref:hypothetical protein n=2 Tax=Paenibacillus massiliensis TaxID=225917 RepID=UPI00037C32AB|nr:hypothetical protein [Paenibacillus massiliensis]